MIKCYYLMLMSEYFNRVGKVQGKHILNMNIRIQQMRLSASLFSLVNVKVALCRMEHNQVSRWPATHIHHNINLRINFGGSMMLNVHSGIRLHYARTTILNSTD